MQHGGWGQDPQGCTLGGASCDNPDCRRQPAAGPVAAEADLRVLSAFCALRGATLRLLELGEGSTALLLETVIRAYGVRESLIEVHAAEAQARGELRHLTGPGQSW